MGTVISLDEHRAARMTGERPSPGTEPMPARTIFYFDLASPFTYFAVERVERVLGAVEWQPVSWPATTLAPDLPGSDAAASRRLREDAEERARTLRMPLVWPDHFPRPMRRVTRAAVYAVESGRGGRFALAAARLAFAGGYHLNARDTIAEAAAAAGLPVEATLAAAADASRDPALERVARELLAAGVDRVPVVRVGSSLFAGEERLAEAAAAQRAPQRRTGFAG